MTGHSAVIYCIEVWLTNQPIFKWSLVRGFLQVTA